MNPVLTRLSHRHELQPLGILLGVSAFLLFILIARFIHKGRTWSLDERILVALRVPGHLQVPIGPLWLEQAAIDISALGGFTVMWLFSAMLFAFFVLISRPLEAGLFAFSVVGSSLLNAGVKFLIARPRPFVVPHLATVSNGSFPSGHAMLSATAYLSLAALTAHTMPTEIIRIYVMSITILIVVAIGISRIYLGVHWPSDVVGGWCLGAAWAFMFSILEVTLTTPKI
jgi:undecaprenyl-diphosphatase